MNTKNYMTNRVLSISKLFLIIFLISFISGCSSPVGEFFSTRYENVMGYFNTYYNAKKQYDEALLELYKNPPKSLDTNYFAPYVANQTVRSKFNIVIEKASKIIQFYPRSKWVDDAIMMIGEVYYYEDDNDLAIKKFSELIENFPTSGHYWKAHLLYARTLYNMEAYDEALNYSAKYSSQAFAASEEDIAAELYLLAGQIYSERGEYIKAEKSNSQALKSDADEKLLAIAAFQLGRVLELIQDYDKARIAYGMVADFKPNESLGFRAELNYAKMLRASGKSQNAMSLLFEMKDQNLATEYFSYVDLEIANTYSVMGDYEKALDQYEMVDTVYKKTDASAKSFYARGLLYETTFHDFKEAKFYYEKAKVENPQSEITPLAVKKVDALNKYFLYHKNINLYDSLFYLAIRQDSIMRANIGRDTASITKTEIDSTKQIPTAQKTDSLLQSRDTLMLPPADLQQDTLTDDGSDEVVEFDDEVILQEPTKLGQQMKEEVAAPKPTTQNQITISPDSALFLITKNQFELATLMMLELSLPDSAEFWFDIVLNSNFKPEYSPRAYYAMAEIQRLRGNQLAVDSLYDLLIKDYGNSDYAIQVKKIKGITIEIEKPELELLYDKALKLTYENKTKEALKIFSQIVSTDSMSKLATKSIYTSGWIYENILNNNDSAKYYYQILIDKYPKSIYTENVTGKVAVAQDTSKLTQYTKIKEIVPPAPPQPKITQQEPPKTKAVQQQRQRGERDVREEDEEDFDPTEFEQEDPPEGD